MSTKHQRIIQLLEKFNLDGLIIRQISNFAWATDGAASYINTAAKEGVGTLLVTKNSRHLIADNFEMPRFENEETLTADGWECYTYMWGQSTDYLTKLTKNLRLGADVSYPGAMDLSGELSVFRSYLDENEQDRLRSLSSLCSEAMNEAILSVKPGMTEYQIAAYLSGAAQKRGVIPIVNLVATDERIYNYRHPPSYVKKYG